MPFSSNRFVEMPYANPRHNGIYYYGVSYWLNPWRCYMDTRVLDDFYNCLGVNHSVNSAFVNSTVGWNSIAQVCATAGIKHMRIEVDWGAFTYSNVNVLSNPLTLQFYSDILNACKNNGIRPLILLNANHISPCPFFFFNPTTTAQSNIGSTTVSFSPSDVSQILPGYTGLMSSPNNPGMGFPLFTSVDSGTGICTTSATLTVTNGSIQLVTMKYHPFSGSLNADNSTNPFCQETINGWVLFVQNSCALVSGILGNNNFDVEIWNKLSNGSNFLDEKNYYSPAPRVTDWTHTNWGATCHYNNNFYALAAISADTIKAGWPGTRVINGLANTLPWWSGISAWKTWDFNSRHFYSSSGVTSYANNNQGGSHGVFAPVNYNGGLDGHTSSGSPPSIDISNHTIVAGTAWAPTFRLGCPEAPFWGVFQNGICQKIQAIPSGYTNARFAGQADIDNFGRDWMNMWRGSTNFWGGLCGETETETNFSRKTFLNNIQTETGCTTTDSRFITLAYWIQAKALMRIFPFYSHKGVQLVSIYTLQDNNDNGFSLLPLSFITALMANNGVLTSGIAAQVGLPLLSLGNLVNFLKSLQSTLTTLVPLTVTSINEFDPVLVFSGDGTAVHPDRYQGENFAILPFQASDSVYAIFCYAATNEMCYDYEVNSDPINTSNYQMPDQYYDVCITGFKNRVTSCRQYDTLTMSYISDAPFTYINSVLTVRLTSTDYSRILVVT